uniref:arsenate reductase (glutathione/glutaredoxin) n=1 Tax=Physcomitrium patens TaxID=3218 RepID=A0A2K1L9X6_PHYPA|nr:arsenate reductase 2.2-like [Physcomitrium patens]PNR62831.1 hypothetical protein PHYPA_001255 [Physcomitrium patens]|eukprot:XP_024368349.1 arsenate reductase 2.2-like [Physcomitrella patens]
MYICWKGKRRSSVRSKDTWKPKSSKQEGVRAFNCESAVAAMAGLNSTVSFVSGQQLVKLQGPKIAVVDVRDEERAFDGHIAGSMHFSSSTFEENLPKLIEEVKNKETVVFHCAFSQVRGPTCARKLSEHLNNAKTEGKIEKVPSIVVLERGFNGWAESGRPICSCQDLVCTHAA